MAELLCFWNCSGLVANGARVGVKMEAMEGNGVGERRSSRKLLLPSWQKNWHRKSTACMKNKYARAMVVLLALVLAGGVGFWLWRASLHSMKEKFFLKCENRKEILKSEVENNLNASFVIIGLVASVPNTDESVWRNFALQTLFLRPNVKSLVYLERVLQSERAAFERKWNGSISVWRNNTASVRSNFSEYAPGVFESQPTDSPVPLLDHAAYPVLRSAIFAARDTGLFTLSPATKAGLNAWLMGAYLAYYGPGQIASSFASPDARRQACKGYVGTVLNVTEIFVRVLSRFIDDADMDVVAVYIVEQSAKDDFELKGDYDCSSTPGTTCALLLYDPSGRSAAARGMASVSWVYGTQQFELRCIPKHNFKLLALRNIIAWPLLMALVVLFFSIIVIYVVKRMQSIERDCTVIENMNEDLKVAKLAAEAADKAKSSFLATVSHEIRTPMNGVIGMTNLLMGTELTAIQLDYVKVAQASGNALIALINDVLDLSKIEAGKMELETVAFNLRKEVDSVFTLFDEKLQQKKLEVFMLVHEAVPTCVCGDPGRFRQILVNLVSNALKFTKEGSILVSVRVMDPHSEEDESFPASDSVFIVNPAPKLPASVQLSQVAPNSSPTESYQHPKTRLRRDESDLGRGNTAPRLSMHPGDEANTLEAVLAWRAWKFSTISGRACQPPKDFTVIVSVEDTGIGIPLHSQHRLFQPFSQADSSTSREYGGTGIGLSICQKLIKLMNGSLTVKSKPGEGSVFEFTLPLSVPETADEKLSSCHKASTADKTKLRGLHVALVDSNIVRQEVTASYLRCLGITIESFTEDVASTLDFLKRDQSSKAVQGVVVDLKGLPHESILELACSIRKIPSLKTLPVLALSMGLSPPGEKELKESGVSHIIAKPLRYAALAAVFLETVGVPARRVPMKKPNAHANMLSGRKLLVVDDNNVNRRVASSMLSRYGATVATVDGGAEAVTAVQKRKAEGEEPFDLVFMDIQMPEVDGWEATRRIRRWELESCPLCQNSSEDFCPHHRLPIVAVTADVVVKTRSLCFSSGMNDYLTKPLDQKQLHALLERFLKKDLVNAPPLVKAGPSFNGAGPDCSNVIKLQQ